MSISGLFAKIYRDIINDQVSLIRIPDMLIRLRKALSEQDMTISMLARVIQTDVGASAYLLNIANSSAYATRNKATDIQAAIRMIGITTFSSLITVYAVRSLAVSTNVKTQKLLKKNWQRSAYRAAIASAIAKITGIIEPDKALLAGLLQDVGALPILMKMQTDQLKDYSDQEIDLALATYSSKVGVVLAQKWKLDEELVMVIKHSRNLAYDSGTGMNLVDIVNIAQLLSQIGDRDLNWPRLEDTPCLLKFSEGGLTMATSMALLKQAQEDINEVRQVLSA